MERVSYNWDNELAELIPFRLLFNTAMFVPALYKLVAQVLITSLARGFTAYWTILKHMGFRPIWVSGSALGNQELAEGSSTSNGTEILCCILSQTA